MRASRLTPTTSCGASTQPTSISSRTNRMWMGLSRKHAPDSLRVAFRSRFRGETCLALLGPEKNRSRQTDERRYQSPDRWHKREQNEDNSFERHPLVGIGGHTGGGHLRG